LAKQVVPAWSSEAEEREGRGCIVHAWVDAAGELVKTELPFCPDGPKAAIEQAAATWSFRAGVAEDLWIYVVPLKSRPTTKTVQPEYPKDATAMEAKCTALLFVDEKGVPAVHLVEGCPDAFDKAVRKVLPSWRFEPDTHPYVRRLSITFKRS